MDGKNGHGLELEKARPLFSSCNAIPAKITQKILWLVLPDKIWFVFFFNTIQTIMWTSIWCYNPHAHAHGDGTLLM